MSAPAVLLGVRHPPDPDTGYAPWLVDFRIDGGIVFPDGRDECVFKVEGFNASDKHQHVVTITLASKRLQQPLWIGKLSSSGTFGFPELVWLGTPAEAT